jgi:hypothetical protein
MSALKKENKTEISPERETESLKIVPENIEPKLSKELTKKITEQSDEMTGFKRLELIPAWRVKAGDWELTFTWSYIHNNETDTIVLNLETWSIKDYLNIDNSELYFKIDSGEVFKLNEDSIEGDWGSRGHTSSYTGRHITRFSEKMHYRINLSDFLKMTSSTQIKGSLRTKEGKVDFIVNEKEVTEGHVHHDGMDIRFLRLFYNQIFDPTFHLEQLVEFDKKLTEIALIKDEETKQQKEIQQQHEKSETEQVVWIIAILLPIIPALLTHVVGQIFFKVGDNFFWIAYAFFFICELIIVRQIETSHASQDKTNNNGKD